MDLDAIYVIFKIFALRKSFYVSVYKMEYIPLVKYLWYFVVIVYQLQQEAPHPRRVTCISEVSDKAFSMIMTLELKHSINRLFENIQV